MKNLSDDILSVPIFGLETHVFRDQKFIFENKL